MSGEGSSSGSLASSYKTEAFRLFRTLSLERMAKKGLDWSREKKELVLRERFLLSVERQRRKLEDLGLLNVPIDVLENRTLVAPGGPSLSRGRMDNVRGDQRDGSPQEGVVGAPDVIHAVPVALAMPYDHASDFERSRREKSWWERERVEELMRCRVDAHDLAELNIKVKT